MSEYDQFKYSHVCDCCEEVSYPLHMVIYRTLPVTGRNRDTGQSVIIAPAKVVTSWVCDRCLPAHEREDQ